ncbi:MAG: TIGR03905 family TSCPD domain-containing protein [Clostridiales bacterium]|nr:TIGR03905 family TSCPD domain-containing protein [Clostridiales bacterium]MDY2835549.1 TIGR03905 family TSCPD domain-containing protein [Candidatus Aphodomonas sp.]
MYSHKNVGTCSSRVLFDIHDGVVTDCTFEGGCRGNLQGVSQLVKGRKVDDVIEVLKGIQCRNGTSCPDQLANALIEWKKEHAQG